MVFDGDLLLYIGEGVTKKPIAYCKTASISVNMNTKEIVTKESGIWNEKINGRLSWSGSADGMYCIISEATNKTTEQLFDALTARTAVDIVFGKEGTTETYTGHALITSLEISSGADEIPTYSMSFEGTGALTKVAKAV
jgi:TP901-1 family phage major tail protein